MIRFISIAFLIFACGNKLPNRMEVSAMAAQENQKILCGADQLELLMPKLLNKRIALVVNHTSILGKIHLADTLKSRGVDIVRIFGPEHGFRGTAADGELVNDSIDLKSGIPVVSLYGKNKKPTAQQVADVDILVFDIQDVGTRFYTYISTMHYIMEVCAENNKKLIILDRPNPNMYVDGPMNEKPGQSFVAMHPIPIAHGLTVGELARMINGEGWLPNGAACELEIIPIKYWSRTDVYSLPIRPSPNLPNEQAIKLYPSLCLFEGTSISLGRGTPYPFQVLGNPTLTSMPFQFSPISIKGVAAKPPHENKLCYGIDLRDVRVEKKIDLSYLLMFYKAYADKENFFTSYFDVLAGTPTLRHQIEEGLTEEQIRASWKNGLEEFMKKRKKYLIYM